MTRRLGLSVCVWALAVGCTGPPAESGSQRMARRLRELAEEGDPADAVFSPERMAKRLRAATPVSPRARTLHDARLAHALLLAGQSGEALGLFASARKAVEQDPDLFQPGLAEDLLSLQAISAMRLGEERNCVQRHGPESCLFPIRGGGVHSRAESARQAVVLYRELLRRRPEDLSARWLLTVAAMSAGDYPDDVPLPLRFGDTAFSSEHEMGRFVDRAAEAGVDAPGLAGGVAMEDFDGDGRLDLLVSSWGLLDPLRFFRNRGDGGFEDRSQEAGLAGLGGGLNLLHADYDNDGDADVLVLRGAWQGRAGRHPDSLLRNDGGRFEDVTEAAGLLGLHPGQAGAWADFDGDGWLDLYLGYESRGADAHPCQLFRNRRDGTFEEVAAGAGVAVTGFVKAVAAGDYDNDGRPDIYVSRLLEPNLLFRNEGTDGTLRFRDVTARAGVAEPLHSFTTWFFDYDNDGWLDLFVSGYPVDFLRADAGGVAADYLGLPTTAERPRLYRNQRDGTFRDVTREAGLHRVLLAMGGNHGDLDGDGWPDLYLGTGAPDLRALMPNRAFRNDRGRRFQDVTTAAGLGHLQKGHGVAFGDIDDDGDQDVYAVLGGAFTGDGFARSLFENPGHGNHWLTLWLEGRRANRSAIGARVKLVLDTPEGEREVHAVISTGGSFGSSSLRQTIGLGTARRVRQLEVVWPGSGRRQSFADQAVDQSLRLREGDAPQPLRLAPFRLAGSPLSAGGPR